MLLNFIVVLLIILITAYLATQGMLSSLLALATSIFSSILAMALFEPLEGIIRSWRRDYARGVTFLLLFLLVFAVTRIAADLAVPKNIKLRPALNRTLGGVVGFFTALVVVGSILIGFEMLPISRTPFGFERFPGIFVMQGADADGKPAPGEIAKPAHVWFAPDRFVLAIWNATSGRSLGGARPWASVHPDLSVESYGYRNQVDGSQRSLPPDLFQVTEAWVSADPVLRDEQGNDHKFDAGKRYVMVRTQVQKGDTRTHVSNDYNGDIPDPYFRVSASQVRLLTDKNRQHYPIGYLEDGRSFVPLTLDAGFLVDDYLKGDFTVEDWIFQVADDEKPLTIEMKQLARADLPGLLKDKPTSPLATTAYPPHQYFKDLCTLTVTFEAQGRELKAGRVYILKPDGVRRDVASLMSAAYNHILGCEQDMINGNNGWDAKGKPGVPSQMTLFPSKSYAPLFTDDDATISWGAMLPLLLLGQARPDGLENLRLMPDYFETTILGAWKNTRKGSLIVGFGNCDETGRVDVRKISAGSHPVVVTLLTDRGFFVWAVNKDFKTSSHVDMTGLGGSAPGGDSPCFRVDLDEKIP